MDLFLTCFRIYIVVLSVVNAICAFRLRSRTRIYRGFATIAAVVPLEWFVFYGLRAFHLLEPVALNAMSVVITAQTLTFLFAFILYADRMEI